MTKQYRFEGDHGLIIEMDEELRKKCKIKKEGNHYTIVIPTEVWEEVIE